MDAELKSLKIDRSKRSPESSRWAARWIVVGILVFVLLGAWRMTNARLHPIAEVEIQRIALVSSAVAPEGVVLNATGYIVAAHKIEVAAKVVGKVKWIGVEKGDRVRESEVMVRLEDDEYQAQLQQADGNLATLQARLDEALHGSRPEEIAQALANVDSAKADLENARITLDRTRAVVEANVAPKQSLDDAQARYDSALQKVNALDRAYQLVKLGPRQEQVAALRGQVEQARGMVAFAQTNLSNTVIRAPVTGTILERAVEKGEFVTTSFVGDRGAKGYVVSLADLNDLEVELDISQADFAKLHANQHGTVTTDAFPDRRYDGFIKEISPEANRQKATVQIKVKIVKPDSYLRPEMNASVAFLSDAKPDLAGASAKPVAIVPASAVRDGAVFVLLNGKAVRRAVKTGATGSQGIRIEEGLIGGEDLIVNPPAGLKDGDSVRQRAQTT
jgi:HlyD family secretion protein